MSKLRNSSYVPLIIEHLPCVLWTYYHFYLAHFPCLNKINNLLYGNITARLQCGILHNNISHIHVHVHCSVQSLFSKPWAYPYTISMQLSLGSSSSSVLQSGAPSSVLHTCNTEERIGQLLASSFGIRASNGSSQRLCKGFQSRKRPLYA